MMIVKKIVENERFVCKTLGFHEWFKSRDCIALIVPRFPFADAFHLKRAIISNHQFFNIYLQSSINFFKMKLFSINCWRSSIQLMIFLLINSKRFAIVLSWSRFFFIWSLSLVILVSSFFSSSFVYKQYDYLVRHSRW